MSWWRKYSQSKQPLIQLSDTLQFILNELKNHGKSAYIVGGAVRDALMNNIPKDIDVEVYGITPEELETILKNIYVDMVGVVKNKYGENIKIHGGVDAVGKSFGVIKFTDPLAQEDYDFSVPRRDSRTGVGHKDFKTEFDPTISPKEAASRRDFTINSLAYDPFADTIYNPLSDENGVIDFFGGVNDLNNGILKHTSPAFIEDPLRVLRGMQLSSRLSIKKCKKCGCTEKGNIKNKP